MGFVIRKSLRYAEELSDAVQRQLAVAYSSTQLLAWGLRTRLREGYSAADFRADLAAALVVGVVALPLSMALAIASGAITSGLGYVIWYAALPGLGSMRAATVQLSVPPIAAFGGTLLLGEAPSLRLIVSSIAILGGIAIVLATRARK